MNLYKVKPQFDTDTGEPTDSILRPDRTKAICDFTGSEIDLEDDVQEPTYNFIIKYDHGCEPNWYEDYHQFEKDFGIDYSSFAEFMESPYHAAHTEEYGCADITNNVAANWMASWSGIGEGKEGIIPELKKCGTLEQVFRYFRLKTLRKLLEERKYFPQQLGLEIDPQFDSEIEF